MDHEFPNFNFNASHHGDYVAIASEPLCIVGLDIVSHSIPGKETIPEFIQIFCSYFSRLEWDSIMNAGSCDDMLNEFYRYVVIYVAFLGTKCQSTISISFYWTFCYGILRNPWALSHILILVKFDCRSFNDLGFCQTVVLIWCNICAPFSPEDSRKISNRTVVKQILLQSSCTIQVHRRLFRNVFAIESFVLHFQYTSQVVSPCASMLFMLYHLKIHNFMTF